MRKDALVVLMMTFLALGGFYWYGFIQSPTISTKKEQVAAIGGDKNNTQGLTLTSVSQHNTPSDCYLVVKGQVYDVSSYISQHPGGRRNITSRCGQEVTGIFASIHSNFAWNLLADYQVGFIDNGQPIDQKNSNNAQNILEGLAQSISKQLPSAEIISIKPSQDKYVAKIIYKNQLMELHLNEAGQILQKEVANDEFDWNSWDSDSDDQ